jgi:hypothetical protein
MSESEDLREIRRRLPRTIARGFGPLHHRNRRLWTLENTVRQTEVPAKIAALKRAIDVANLARHAGVAHIDAAVLACYRRGRAPHQRGAVIDSSSVGQMLDRLSILALKRARVVNRTALEQAALHWEHTVACLERAVAALAAGRWVHHSAGEVKQYGARRAATSRARAERRRGRLV